MKCWSEAENDYNWIVERYPEDAFALYKLGNIFGSNNDWLEAESFYKKASFADPSFAKARSSRALALYQLGEIEEAELELRKLHSSGLLQLPEFQKQRKDQ